MEKSKTMIKRIAALFFRDIQWKLLCLGLAFLLWFIGVNVNDPIQTNSYDNLPITILHRDQLAINGAVILNEREITGQRGNVSVRATRNSHALINAARHENIHASIDLNTVDFAQVQEADDYIRVPIDVNVFIHQDYVASFMNPSTVDLILDQYDTLLRSIEVDLIGTPMEGFEARPGMLTQPIVRLTGARSALREVSGVRVQAFIDGAEETLEELASLVVYNNNWDDITNTVDLSISEVHVRIPILPYEAIELTVNPIGLPMPGFMATEVSIYPPSVSLVGNAEIFEEGITINLGDMDMNLANQNIVQTFDIRPALLGTGLTLREGEPAEAEVTLVIEQITTRDILFPLESLEIEGYIRPFTFENEVPVTISVRGRRSVIEYMDIDEIAATLDLTGLGAGTHTIQINVELPRGATLTNPATVDISIEPEPIVFEPEELQDWTADLNGNGDEE